ncbi:MAG: hypothetical protein IJ728_00745 [Selenomonadaceae bacterium]|nr:hypothetical protein [Selenomonadaceae bacterium]
MAESVGSLYIRLGLSLSELTSDFIAADRSINENMNRLNREMQVIRLRAEVELNGLDEVADAEQRFQVQTNRLNDLIRAQQQRISLANAAYQDMRERLGENSAQTQRAQVALERERAALARLERELRNVNETQSEANEEQRDFSGSLTTIAEKAAPVIIAIVGIKEALQAVGEATTSLIEDFRELQQQAYELNMSVNDTENFLRHMRLAGGDIGDFEGFIRGITDAWVKGDVDDPETLAMKKYGVEIENVNGRLKDFKSITEEVYQGFLKARDNGEAINYLQMLGGESGIRDAIQYFERYEEALEDVKKIYQSNINAAELHKADRELNLLSEQAIEFGNAIRDIATPATRMAMQNLFDIFHAGTEILVENKEEIQRWQFIALEAANKVKDGFLSVIEAMKPLNESSGFENFTAQQNEQIKNLHSEIEKLNEFDTTPWGKIFNYDFDMLFGNTIEQAESNLDQYNEELQATQRETEELEKASKEMGDALSYGLRDSLKRATEYKDELKDLKNEMDFKDKIYFETDEYSKSIAELDTWYERSTRNLKKVTEEQKKAIEENIQSVAELLDDPLLAEDKRTELIAQNKNLQEMLASNFKASKEEELALAELVKQRRLKIEQDQAAAIAEIHREIAAIDKTDLEKTYDEIEKAGRAFKNRGVDDETVNEFVDAKKAEALEELEKEVAANIDSIWQNELEKRLAQIDREKQAWIDKGVEEVKATEWAEKSKSKLIEEVQSEFNAARDALYQDDLEKELARIDASKEAWIQKGISEVEATQWAEEAKDQARNKANQKEAQIAQQRDQRRKQEIEAERRAAIEKANAQRNVALQVLKSEIEDYRLYQEKGITGLIEKQKQELYKIGITDKDLQMTPAMLNEFKKAQHEAMQNLLPNFAKTPYESPWANYERKRNREPEPAENLPKGKYKNTPEENQAKIDDPVQAASKGLTNVADAGSAAADALNKIGNINPESKNKNDTEPSNSNSREPFDPEINGYITNGNQKAYSFRDPNDPDNLSKHGYMTPEQIQREIANGRNFNIDPTIESLQALKGQERLNDFLEPFQNLGNNADKAANNLSDLAPKLNDFKNDIPTLNPTTPDNNLPENIPDLNSEIQNVQSAIQEANQMMNNATSAFSSLIEQISVLNQNLNNLSNQNQQPANITNNISANINEAHAWDYAHIQELANKVADVLRPHISRALGGDPNAY